MANTYKNIVITPNIGNTADPKIVFSGGNTTVNTDIALYVYPDANGTLSFEGSAGQLFSITNDLANLLFSVTDVSGIPSLEVYANSLVSIAPLGGNVVFGNTAELILSPGAGIYANGGLGTAGQLLASNGTSVYWVSPTGVDVNAQYVWTNTQTFSNTITFSQTIIGTANNASNLNGKAEAALNVNSALNANNSTNLGGVAAAGYQTTAGLSANVATLTSNNATNAFGKTEGALNVNSALTANNSTNLGGQAAAFYTNATNITTGTLPYAQIPANIINTTAAFTRTGITTFSANVVLGSSGLSANGSFGTDTHVLHSNGTAAYWAADDQGVTSVATGNGMTGGTITATGTVSVLANTGIVANATGVYVNATYIGTLTSNNATNAFGKTEGNLNVNNATTAYSKAEGALNVNSALTANNSTNLGGVAAASYVQNTDSRVLSGNLNFTGANTFFTAGLRANGDIKIGTASSTETSGVAYQRFFTKTVAAGELYRLCKYDDTEGNIQLLITVSSETGSHSGTSTYLWQGGFNSLSGANGWYRLLPLNTGRGHGDGPDTGENSNAWNVLIYGTTITGSNYQYGVAVSVPAGRSAKTLKVTIEEIKRGMTFTDESSIAVVTSWTIDGTIYSHRNLLVEGNVGISNTAPTHKLRVDGTTSLAGAVSDITTLAAGNTTVTGFANVSTSVNSALLTVGTAFIANTTGAYHTGVVNSASHTVGTAFIANSTAIVGTGYANVSTSVNSALLTVGTSFIANTTGAYHTGTMNAASHTVGTAFTANSTVVNAVSYYAGSLLVANSTVSNATHLGGQLPAYYTNATNITTGTLPYAQIPANIINTTAAFTRTGITTFSANIVLGSSGVSSNGVFGTAGQVLHSNGTATYWAADDNSGTVTSVATGNGMTGGTITATGTVSVLANTGIVANATGVFVNATYIGTLTSNNATNAFGKTEGALNVNNATTAYSKAEGALNVNSALTANNSTNLGGTAAAGYQTTAGLSANVATLTANNSNNLGGQLPAYYTNATNITTGTLPYAQIPANVINTTAAFTRTGITTFSANVVLGSSGLSANGIFGTAGQVLHSNGTATYWDADDNSGTVTSVATGNGMTGGTITATGTVSVLANTGIVANATGVYVNATYIGTLTSNNATNAFGKTEGALNVNSATTALTANNSTNFGGQLPAYYTNATNITTGTLPYAQIPSNIINTTAAFTRTGITTFSANVVLGSSGLSANGSFGTATHVLHSNGTATYWAADDNSGGTVTSVATGNGMTGGTITATGTVSVLANTGIVANATGVFVNATYIGTISANNASFLGTVAAASYVQNTDSRVLSGNLNFTGTNNFFSTGLFVGANVIANTTALFVGNSTANSTTNATAVIAHIQHASRPTLGFNYTVSNTVNSLIVGPYTVNTGFTLTVETGARLVIA